MLTVLRQLPLLILGFLLSGALVWAGNYFTPGGGLATQAGSGTTDQIAKFVDPTTLADSNISDTAGTVTIDAAALITGQTTLSGELFANANATVMTWFRVRGAVGALTSPWIELQEFGYAPPFAANTSTWRLYVGGPPTFTPSPFKLQDRSTGQGNVDRLTVSNTGLFTFNGALSGNSTATMTGAITSATSLNVSAKFSASFVGDSTFIRMAGPDAANLPHTALSRFSFDASDINAMEKPSATNDIVFFTWETPTRAERMRIKGGLPLQTSIITMSVPLDILAPHTLTVDTILSHSPLTLTPAFGDGVIVNQASPAAATKALLRLGTTALVGGSAAGTFVGANPGAFTGDFINFQVASSTKFKISNTGQVSILSAGLPQMEITSGAATVRAQLNLGRTFSGGAAIAFLGNNDEFLTGTLQGDLLLRNTDSGRVVFANSTLVAIDDSGGPGFARLIIRGTPNPVTTQAKISLGPDLLGGSANGTFIGANPGGFTGNWLHFQIAGNDGFKVAFDGTISLGASPPATLARDGGDIIALKRGIASNALRIYGTEVGPVYLQLFNDGSQSNIGFVGGTGILAATFNQVSIIGTPQANATTPLLNVGGTATVGGSGTGTYIGVNAVAGFAGDFINWEINGTTLLKIRREDATTASPRFSTGAVNEAFLFYPGAGANRRVSILDDDNSALISTGNLIVRHRTAVGSAAILRFEDSGGADVASILTSLAGGYDFRIGNITKALLSPTEFSVIGTLRSTLAYQQVAQAAALGNPTVNEVRYYTREDIDQGVGTVAADCALVARLSSGVEVLIQVLVVDGGCP